VLKLTHLAMAPDCIHEPTFVPPRLLHTYLTWTFDSPDNKKAPWRNGRALLSGFKTPLVKVLGSSPSGVGDIFFLHCGVLILDRMDLFVVLTPWGQMPDSGVVVQRSMSMPDNPLCQSAVPRSQGAIPFVPLLCSFLPHISNLSEITDNVLSVDVYF
jgi:hypothetical protein